MIEQDIVQALGLKIDEDYYVLFRDHVTGLEYIRKNTELKKQGLFLALKAYQFHVFWEFRQVRDNKWKHYQQLRDYLGNRGVPDIAKALQEVILAPLHQALVEALSPSVFETLLDLVESKRTSTIPESVFYSIEKGQRRIVNAIQKQERVIGKEREVNERARKALIQIFSLP